VTFVKEVKVENVVNKNNTKKNSENLIDGLFGFEKMAGFITWVPRPVRPW
jgi:hypothetical protein